MLLRYLDRKIFQLTFNDNRDMFKRRALEAKEVALLLASLDKPDTSFGMSGRERALLYRLAIESGLRSNELRSLTRSSFNFENQTVLIKAEHAKNRKEAVLPLKPDTAILLKEFVADKMPSAVVFKMPSACNVVRMLRKDLEAAKIDPKNNGKGKLDFHSLRHTTGSLLAASGVHPKTAQNLLRHSTIDLTMNIYTHSVRGAEAAAVESLPDFRELIKAQAVKTGTDEKPAIQLDNQLDNAAYFDRHKQSVSDSMDRNKPVCENNHKSFNNQKLAQTDRACHKWGKMGRGGFEPPTHGFSVWQIEL